MKSKQNTKCMKNVFSLDHVLQKYGSKMCLKTVHNGLSI
jgi:hypothetical protein